MLPQMVLALLALAELSAVGEQQCLSGDRQPNVCFSTAPTLAATPLSTNASLADACCSACLQVPQCCCWTYDARNNDSHGPEAGDLCELKHLLVNGSTAPSCVSGTLPIAPPLVLPPPRGAHSVLFLAVTTSGHHQHHHHGWNVGEHVGEHGWNVGCKLLSISLPVLRSA
jgi:hypothetical protein